MPVEHYGVLKGIAIDISSLRTQGFNEQKFGAPMDRKTLREILIFKDFMKKYDTGNSDFEKIYNKTLLICKSKMYNKLM
ncbi:MULTISPECIES: YukJ family protein [Bacillus]|uniref:YukJ family protein n=1 Tax=Bacillus TaxID=1386 RepID=UPI001F549646|nr:MULTISPECIES: YukJ family protein [Bacillus]